MTKLRENNNLMTRLDLTEDDGRISLAVLNVKFSLIADPAEDIIRRVDADLARLKDENMLTSASGHVDELIAVAQAGVDATKFTGSCVESLGKTLQIFVKAMDNIADAHPIVKVSWTVLSVVYKTVQAQIIQDEAILGLAGSLPGCGKTILSSSIVANVTDVCIKNKSSACAYFFFDGRDGQSILQRHDGFIRSLIQQFIDQCGGIPTRLAQLYGRGHQQPPTDALEDVLQHIIRGFQDTYVIIDSLDECTDRQELVAWISRVTSSPGGQLHLLSTSRPEKDIVDSLKSPQTARTFMLDEFVEGDIKAFIGRKIHAEFQEWDEGYRSKIKDVLVKGAHGMFRWVALQLEELHACPNVHALERQLRSLPEGLDETYERIFLRINKHRRDDARRFFTWITFSTTTLTLKQLAEVVVVDFEAPNVPVYDSERKYRNQEDVLLACSGLITNSDGFVKLAHFSVKEYLLSDRVATGGAKYFSLNENLSHLFIAETSLAYLLHLDSPGPFEDEILADATLAGYAANNWVFHVRAAGGDGVHAIYKLILALLESKISFNNWIRLWDPYWQLNGMRTELLKIEIAEPLYYAALLGFTEVSRQLLQQGVSVDGQGSSGDGALEESSRMQCGVPLQAACSEGHMEMAKLLLEKGADVNAQEGKFGSALQAAAWNDDEAIVKLLLEKGADINAQGGRFCSALQAAAERGDEVMVKLLLEKGADINAQGGLMCGSALQAAAWRGDEAIVKLLLEKGADVNAKGGKLGNTLHAAARSGDEAMVKLLLEKGADVNAQGGVYGSVFMAALEKGDLDMANSLMARADFNLQAGAYVTPLQAAALTGNLAIVKSLLDLGAEVNTQVGLFSSPLQAASFRGHFEIVKLLLENNADVNAQGGSGGNALLMASFAGHEDVAKLLLENHADANASARDCIGIFDNYPFMSRIMQATQSLREKEADDADAQGEYTYALQAASHKGHVKIVTMLLDHGAEVSAQGGTDMSALQAALDREHENITKILLEHGATPPLLADF